jgi:hypothetical protein
VTISEMIRKDYATNSRSVVLTRDATNFHEGVQTMKPSTATIRSFNRSEPLAVRNARTQRAVAASRASKRRRFATGTADAVADAAFATGGLMVANAVLRLNVGVPSGRLGILLGIVLVAVGAAIAKASSRRTTLRPDPATSALPVVIRLDEPSAAVIHLDQPADLEVRRAA